MSEEIKNEVTNEEPESENITFYSEEDLYKLWDTWTEEEKHTALTLQRFSVQFIKDHINEIDWYALSVNINLTCDILDTFMNKIKWPVLCMSPNGLSDVILYNYYTKIDWPIVLSKQQLNVQLLVALSEKYRKSRSKKAKIFWNSICRYQQFDIEYVDMYRRFLNFKFMSYNPYVTDDIIDKYIKEFDLQALMKLKEIDPEVLRKHAGYIKSEMAKWNQQG